jgi:hypothetical protein
MHRFTGRGQSKTLLRSLVRLDFTFAFAHLPVPIR